MRTVLPVVTSTLALLFAIEIGVQWVERRRPHQLVWALALACFATGAACEFVGAVWGWSVPLYRAWYLAGAMYAAAWLGLGSVFLLVPRRVALWAAAIVAALSVIALIRVLQVNVAAADVVPPSGEVRPPAVHGLPGDVVALVAVLNSFGTIAVIGGALWSAWRFRTAGWAAYRVVSNVLIAGGALVVGAAGTLTRLGRPEYLFVGEFFGIVLIYAGFLRSRPRISLPLVAILRGGGGRPHTPVLPPKDSGAS